MTTLPDCRTIYDERLHRSAVYDPPGVSGPESGEPSGDTSPEDDHPSEYLCRLDRASRLTPTF